MGQDRALLPSSWEWVTQKLAQQCADGLEGGGRGSDQETLHKFSVGQLKRMCTDEGENPHSLAPGPFHRLAASSITRSRLCLSLSHHFPSYMDATIPLGLPRESRVSFLSQNP